MEPWGKGGEQSNGNVLDRRSEGGDSDQFWAENNKNEQILTYVGCQIQEVKNYDTLLYEKATSVMPLWNIKKAGVPPADAPFHKGAIRYLKEKGVWKAKYDEWNDKRIEHLKTVQKAWDRALKKAEAKKMKSKKFPAFWLKERAKALEAQ